MRRYLFIVLVVLALAVLPVQAENLLTETTQTVQLSLVGGTAGWGAAAYWPLGTYHGTTAGPWLGIGTEAVAAGAGLKLSVNIPVLADFVNFVAVGAQVKFAEINSSIGWEDLEPALLTGYTF